MENRWLSGALKAPGQAIAEDALGCSVSWESKNSQDMKNTPPSAGGDQPTRPAAKHSLCTGKPSGNSSVLLPPVNQNWLWCLKEWSQTYHLSNMPHKPSDWKLSFILMKSMLRKGRVITSFPSVKCPKEAHGAIPQRGSAMVSSAFKARKLYKQNGYSKILLHALKKKKHKTRRVWWQPSQRILPPKNPPSSAISICCGIWTAADRVRAVSFAYSRDAKQYTLSFFRKCFRVLWK